MRATSLGRRLGIVAASVAALTGAGLLLAAPASAATGKNGVLESGELGLYYNSYQGGCVFDLFIEDTNFSGDTFKGSCSGSGQSTNDNTASYHNRDSLTWYVYTDASAGGIEGSIPSGYVGNASATFKNEISSAYYYDARP